MYDFHDHNTTKCFGGKSKFIILITFSFYEITYFQYVPNIISNLQYIFEFIIKKPPNEANDQEKNIDEEKEEHFLALDSDGDKRITREELIQYLHKLEGMNDEQKRNKRDPEQISKERDELIEDIFKSKGRVKLFAKYHSYCLKNFQSCVFTIG